jgi:hypothetical protein
MVAIFAGYRACLFSTSFERATIVASALIERGGLAIVPAGTILLDNAISAPA